MDQSPAQRRREQMVDESLKQVFGDPVQDLVPDRLQVLLEALRREETNKPKEE